MKRSILISYLSLLIGFTWSASLAQTTYYVSATGNDALPGTTQTTAWQSLTKVNAAMPTLVTGDQILFNKGDTFYGQLLITKAGITIGAYGSGEKPILSGGQRVTSAWTVTAGNVWETTLTGTRPTVVNKVIKNDIGQPISRHPNKDVNNGYFNFESHVGQTQITDNQLSGTPSWAGSEMVLRGERYRLIRLNITAHSGGTLTWASNPAVINVNDGFGYFFRNDLKAIDRDGEWAYAASTGKLYLSSTTDPNSASVVFSRTDNVVVIQNASNVVIDGIQVKHANVTSVSVTSSNNTIIRNSTISESGGGGIYYQTVQGATIQNNVISRIAWNGINAQRTSSSLIIQGNQFSYIGDEAYGTAQTFYGIYSEAANSQMVSNTFDQIGLAGIVAGGLNTLIKRNVVDHCVLFGQDMAGIYTSFNLNDNAGTIIEENIVTNVIGEVKGAPTKPSLVHGIYVDNFSNGVTVRNNTVAFVDGSCYFVNSSRTGNKFINNTAFGGGENEFCLNSADVVPNWEVTGNIFASANPSASHRIISSKSKTYTPAELGTFTDNFIASPFSQTVVDYTARVNNMIVRQVVSPYGWESLNPQINGTFAAPVMYPTGTNPDDVVKFYYNKTTENQTITLPTGTFVDAKNQAYCGTLTLLPFTSVVLFRTGTGGCTTPVACNDPTGLTVSAVTDISAQVSWGAASGALNYDVRYKPVGGSTYKYGGNVSGTSLTLQGLTPGVGYELQIRASCYGAEGNWSANQPFTTLASAPQLAPASAGTRELLGSSTFLTWEPVRGATTYTVRYRTQPSGAWTTRASITQTELFIADLSASTTYEFQVQAQFGASTSDWSASTTFTTRTGGVIRRSETTANNRSLTFDLATNSVIETPTTPAGSFFVGRTGEFRNGVAVYPFPLPALASGQQINEANFTIQLEGTTEGIVTDLWALAHRPSPEVQVGDYYDGETVGSNQATATLIQSPWVDGSGTAPNQSISPTPTGRTTLKNTLMAQYAAGATSASWFFLRINGPFDATNRVFFDRFDDADDLIPAVSMVLSPLSSNLPTPVNNLTATTTSASSISLTWRDNSANETGFVIERRLPGGPYAPIGTVAAGVTTFSSTSLAGSRTYLYRVLAQNADGAVGYSAEASATTGQVAPTLQGMVTSNTSVSLTWTNIPGETGYVLERKRGNGSFSPIASPVTDATTYTDNNLVTFEPYTYRIKGNLVSGGSTDYSSEVTLRLETASSFTYVDARPTGAGANTGPASSIGTLTNENTDNKWIYKGSTSGAVEAGFEGIPASAADGNIFQSFSSTEDAPPLLLTVSSGLNPCETYDVYLYYISPATQLWQTQAKLSTDSQYKLFNRTTAGAEKLPDNANPDSDRLFRAKIGTVSGVTSFSVDIDDSSTGGSLRSVFDGIGYRKVGSATPAAPTQLAVTPNPTGGLLLNWQDESSAETNFVIERKTSAGSFSTLTVVAANTTAYTDPSAVTGTAYAYRVFATAGDCRSATSNEATGTAVMPTPAPALVVSASATCGLPISVTASGCAGTVNWSTAGGTATNALYTVSTPGTYTIAATCLQNGLQSTPSNVTVTIYALPAKPQLTATPASLSWVQGTTSATLEVTNCAGTVEWQGGSGSGSGNRLLTIPASTSAGTYVFSATCRSQNDCLSEPTSVTVVISAPSITVAYRDGDAQLTNNQLKPFLRLNNTGTNAIPYSELTVRYWFTAENFAGINTWIDYAQVGNNRVKMKYVSLPVPRNGALGYVEYSFDASAGNLLAGANSGEIQSRIANANWANLNEADDYSYAANTAYSLTNKVTVYRQQAGGQPVLIWGTEPTPVDPTVQVRVQSENKNNNPATNTISTWLKVDNTGNVPVSYKDLTVRYWFSAEGIQPLNYWIDFAELSTSRVKGRFQRLVAPLAAADTYFELRVDSTAGQLYPLSSSGNIQYRVAKNDWSNFNEANDHSYKAAAPMSLNERITVYYKGQLVYGTEPLSGGRLAVVSPEIGLTAVAYPNPATDRVTVEVRGAGEQKVSLQLTNPTGRVIFEQQVNPDQPLHRLVLPLTSYPAGLYLLRVNTSQETTTLKIIKQ